MYRHDRGGARAVTVKCIPEIKAKPALFVHGYSGIIANHSLEFDEAVVAAHSERVYIGAIIVLREKMRTLHMAGMRSI